MHTFFHLCVKYDFSISYFSHFIHFSFFYSQKTKNTFFMGHKFFFRSGKSPRMPSSEASQIPLSQMSLSTSRAGVTSKPQFFALVWGGQCRTVVHSPLALDKPETKVTLSGDLSSMGMPLIPSRIAKSKVEEGKAT